jgi:SPW repeat
MATDRAEARLTARRERTSNAHAALDPSRPSTEEQHSAAHGHAQMLRQWIWRDFTNIRLGVWLLASPVTLGYADTALFWSDIASGVVIVVLGLLTLSPRFDLARWASVSPVSGCCLLHSCSGRRTRVHTRTTR